MIINNQIKILAFKPDQYTSTNRHANRQKCKTKGSFPHSPSDTNSIPVKHFGKLTLPGNNVFKDSTTILSTNSFIDISSKYASKRSHQITSLSPCRSSKSYKIYIPQNIVYTAAQGARFTFINKLMLNYSTALSDFHA